MSKISLGIGVLNWIPNERRSDRYGTVHLGIDANDSKQIEPKKIRTQYGKLIAVIRETRDSRHIGDLFRGISPTKPSIGDEIVLGEGKLFYEVQEGMDWKLTAVGLKPILKRHTSWLNPEQLYKVHEQTVELFFEPVKLSSIGGN